MARGRFRWHGIRATNIGSEYTEDELEFLKAIDEAKRRHGPFLTWSQVLAVVRSLGYRRGPGGGPCESPAG